METRANYVLIGVFTLVGIVAGLALVLWLAKVDVDRQYAYYDVLFDDVSGLSVSSSVRYNGLPVGQVSDLNLDSDDPSKVRVQLEVQSDTPVKTDTVATLQSSGITGVSTVALSGGTTAADTLPEGAVITSKRSALESIFQGAPQLLEEAIGLLEEIRSVVNEQNRDAVGTVLSNLSSASGRLDQVLSDFEGLSGDLGTAAREVAGFTNRLDSLSDVAEQTLNSATRTLDTANTSLQGADVAVNTAIDTMRSAETAFDTANTLMQDDLTAFVQQGTAAAASVDSIVTALEPTTLATLQAAQNLAQVQIPQLLAELQTTAEALETQITSLGGDATALMSKYTEVGQAVLERAQQTERAIADFEEATVEATKLMASVRATSDSARSFIDEQGRPLATEATQTLSAARVMAETTVPALISQAETTLATINTEAQSLSASAGTLMVEATARLQEAKTTLENLDKTLQTADEAMVYVEDAAQSFDDLVTGDGAAMVANVNAATADASAAIKTINEVVQQSLPGLMSDVRTAAQTANRVVDSVGNDVTRITDNLDILTRDGSAALVAATATFATANTTLNSITNVMDDAEGTLASAESAFGTVNRILNEDIDVMVSDIRGAVSAFTATVENVSTEVDTISAEILSASQSASNLLGTIDSVVADNQRQVDEFLRFGLPQFNRFTEEARRLVVNLERFVDRLERDPARFLLGTNSSEYRR